MPESDLYLRSRRVLTPEGEHPAMLHVRNGLIEAVLEPLDPPSGAPVVDLGDLVLMPGVVDTHVHVNEPGRTEWEGFETATRAAALGGITTLVDMPLNSMPVTATLRALEVKQAAAVGKGWIDHGFWGGVVPGNAAELEPMIEAGVLGFKAFLCHSGIDDFPNLELEDLRETMPVLARHRVPLLVHAELPVHPAPEDGDPRKYATFLASRPSSWEVAAIRQMIDLCREFGTPVHIVHLSAADALPDLAAAKREGLPITVETCPHYLVFSAEEIPDGATHFKCAPPIREAANRERLWQGLADGVIDFVACDHSPCTPDLKLMEEGDFMRAWGGVSSLQFSLPVVWTHAHERGLGLKRVVQWLCGRTARFAGLGSRKGAIAPGYDADLVVWDPAAPFTVEPGMVAHRHKITPYAGRTLLGRVEATYLRGMKIVERGQVLGGPRGQSLVRLGAAREMA